jgi:histidine triad (HIT) family protein
MITASGEFGAGGTTDGSEMKITSDPDCLFCKIVAGQIPAKVVRDTPDFLAFRDIAPQARTHVLVIPKTHAYRNAAELAAGDPQLAAGLLAEGARVAEQEGLAEHAEPSGYRFVFNTDQAAGQTVFHVHLHVLGGEQLGHFGFFGPARTQ